MFACVHEVCQLGPTRAEQFGDLAPDLAHMSAVGLIEGLPDRGGDDGVPTARDVSQRLKAFVHPFFPG